MKPLIKFFGIILLILVGALLVLTVSLNKMIRTGVETLGTTITGTEVALEKADISLFTGQWQLENLVVHNPPGFHTEYAFNMKSIQVTVDLVSALSDTVSIYEIFIDSPQISFEGTLEGSNIGKIQENVKAFARSNASSDRGSVGKRDEAGGSQKEASSEKKIHIAHFILKNAQITLSTPYLKGQQVMVLLPEVHLRDIGKQPGGATLRDISPLVYSATHKAIEQEILNSGMLVGPKGKKFEKELRGFLKDASKLLKGFKGILGN